MSPPIISRELRDRVIDRLMVVGRSKRQTVAEIASALKVPQRDIGTCLNQLRTAHITFFSRKTGWILTKDYQYQLAMLDARQSTLLAVGWIPASNPGPELFRGRVTADLGVVDPPFTDDEMQRITFAAKREAARVVAGRRK